MIGFDVFSLTRKYDEEEVGWESWDSPGAVPKATKPLSGKSGNSQSANGGLDLGTEKTNKKTGAANNQDWTNKWEDDAWEELNK
jgi:hypothetical protein